MLKSFEHLNLWATSKIFQLASFQVCLTEASPRIAFKENSRLGAWTNSTNVWHGSFLQAVDLQAFHLQKSYWFCYVLLVAVHLKLGNPIMPSRAGGQLHSQLLAALAAKEQADDGRCDGTDDFFELLFQLHWTALGSSREDVVITQTSLVQALVDPEVWHSMSAFSNLTQTCQDFKMLSSQPRPIAFSRRVLWMSLQLAN